MIHDLTAGHFDAGGAVSKAIDMRIVRRLLAEMGGKDVDGVATLDGGKVRFEAGCVILSWKGGRTNRVAERFALRLQRETGCALADREHGRVIEPVRLLGLGEKEVFAS